MEYFGRQIDVEFKDDHERDPVTAADKAAQEYLVAEISKRFPDHGILGEEGTKKRRSLRNWPRTFSGCWIHWTAPPTS